MQESRGVRTLIAGWMSIALAATAACGLHRERGRDVLFITIDTLRADHLGCYGDPGARTALLDRWARRGAIVQDFIADVPLTLPSHATLFTGRTALSHGVRVNGGARLGESAVTLAEHLASRGFLTGAVVSSLVVHSRFGLAQGFVFYEDSLTSPYVPEDESRFPRQRNWLPKQDRRAKEAITQSIAWLQKSSAKARRSPFFHWLHLYDAHFPYDPPRPWERIASDLYGAEIASLDRELVRLDRWIQESERGDLVLAVTSDHGEGLGSHLEDEHGIFVYDEVVRVPFLIAASELPASVRGEQARTIDLPATLIELAAGETEGSAFGDGKSLVPFLAGKGGAPDTAAYSESIHSRLAYSASGLKSIRTKSWKMIAATRPELYDLVRDPAELHNLWPILSEEKREAARRLLRDEVGRTIRERGTTDAEGIEADAETAEALRALGYAATAGRMEPPRSVDEEMSFEGFDPKDVVDVVLAGRDLENGFLEKAEGKLQRFFRSPHAEVPALRSLAHQNAAKAAIMRLQFSRAASEYEKALQAEPTNPDAAWSVVYAWNLGGRPEAGERRGRELIRSRPHDEKLLLHYALSLALLHRPSPAVDTLDRLAKEAKDAETAAVAALYAEKIGTAEEARYLDVYLKSETVAP
jgi:arylsulfatase A-like enzyme